MNPRCHLLLATVALAGCVARSGEMTEAHAVAIRDSVRTTLSTFRARSAAAQWDSVVTFYADDPGFRWVEEGRVVADSAEDIRREMRRMAPGLRIETDFSGTEIAPLGPGAASVVTGFTTRFVDSSGVKFAFGGMMTLVMVHREGRWQFLTGHSSAPPNHATGS